MVGFEVTTTTFFFSFSSRIVSRYLQTLVCDETIFNAFQTDVATILVLVTIDHPDLSVIIDIHLEPDCRHDILP